MTNEGTTREHAVAQLQTAREQRDRSSDHYDAARESPGEIRAFAELQVALDQFAAREAWLAWVDRDY